MFAPYSPKVKKNANTLCFTLPGFSSPIYVPFTGRRLAVCERCKKNFKTRDHCRTRDCHVDLPWSETFVCVSLDHSCTDDNGKLLKGPFYARAVPPIAFNFDGEIDRQTPICAPCKDKNYTRKYCRLQKKHRQLPWSSVYVILTLTPDNFGGFDSQKFAPPITSASPSHSSKRRKLEPTCKIIDDGDQEKEDDDRPQESGKEEEGEDKSTVKQGESVQMGKDSTEGEKADADDGSLKPNETSKKDDHEENDEDEQEGKKIGCKKNSKKSKINEEEEAKKMEDIPPSRTFLATVSCKGCTIEVSLFIFIRFKQQLVCNIFLTIYCILSSLLLFNSGSN